MRQTVSKEIIERGETGRELGEEEHFTSTNLAVLPGAASAVVGADIWSATKEARMTADVDQDQGKELLMAIRKLGARPLTNERLSRIYGVGVDAVTQAIRGTVESDRIRPTINKFPDDVGTAAVDLTASDKLSAALGVPAFVLPVARAPIIAIPACSDDPRANDEEMASCKAFHSDWVHYQLGRAMSLLLRGRIRDNDRIGVSSGRGVRYTINALAPGSTDSMRVTLMSLTGALQMRAHSLHSVIMDGDQNVAALATHFKQEVSVRMAGCNIAEEEATPWFEQPEVRGPNKVLVGIGILEGGNRFCAQESRGGLRKRPEPLDSVETVKALFDRLELAVAKYKDRGGESSCLVADVANYFYVVEPTEPLPVELSALVEEIRALVNDINGRLKRISPERMRQAEAAWVVAGTAEKALAIHSLLKLKLFPVDCLVTDSFAAEKLLKLYPRRSANPPRPAPQL